MMNSKSTLCLSTTSLVTLLIHSVAVYSFTIPSMIMHTSPSRQLYPNHHGSSSTYNILFQSSSSSSSSNDTTNSNNNVIATIDVSDLGLTIEDLNKPLPKELLSSIERSGYQSTSRIPDVNDNGCYWVENANKSLNNESSSSAGTIDVTLTIPGLRGQPAACLAVLFSTTTISVTAFGRVVWSCIQRGSSIPEGCSFLTEDGKDMIPVIQLSVEKKDKDEVWDGFILQVGEDSIL